NASSEMPAKRSSASPKRPKTVRTAAATTTARIAEARRAAGAMPCVSATNIGATATGSMTTKSVRKAEAAWVRSIAQHAPICGRLPTAGVRCLGVRLLQLLQRGEPQRLGAVQRLHHLGVFLLPDLHLARLAGFVE